MPGEIEFLDAESTPGDDESLAPSGHRPRTRATSGRLVAGGGVVVVLIGLLVGRAVTSDVGTPVAVPSRSLPTVGTMPSAAALPSSARLPSTAGLPTAAAVTLDPSTGLVLGMRAQTCLPSNQVGGLIQLKALRALISRAGGASLPCAALRPAQCPEADDGQNACQVTRTLPPAVLDAIRANYPQARLTFAYSEIAGQTQLIWYRLVGLSVSRRTAVVITLEQPGNDPGSPGVVRNGQASWTRAVHTGRQLNTTVEVIAPPDERIDADLPARLVADPRLASVG